MSVKKIKSQNSTLQESEIMATNENKELRSRRVKFIDDNRKYIPVLDFDGEQNQIILQVKSHHSRYEDGKPLQFVKLKVDTDDKKIKDRNPEIVDASISNRRSNKMVVLAASSPVELVDKMNEMF